MAFLAPVLTAGFSGHVFVVVAETSSASLSEELRCHLENEFAYVRAFLI